jgi:hypothetical protein
VLPTDTREHAANHSQIQGERGEKANMKSNHSHQTNNAMTPGELWGTRIGYSYSRLRQLQMWHGT